MDPDPLDSHSVLRGSGSALNVLYHNSTVLVLLWGANRVKVHMLSYTWLLVQSTMYFLVRIAVDFCPFLR